MKNINLFCFVVIMAGGLFLLACFASSGNWSKKNSNENCELAIKLPLLKKDKPFEYKDGSLDIWYMGFILRLDMSSGTLECTLFDIDNMFAVSFGEKSKTFLISKVDNLDEDVVVSVRCG
ncbi:hypothetical protein K8R30_00470 [archaeon]|nr:hypothetical protein [archaeon]